WTTLSRTPRGHSSPPRDLGLALRRISPEDTGPRRGAPCPPRLTRSRMTETTKAAEAVEHPGGRRFSNEESSDTRGGRGRGEVAPRGPYLLRRFSEAPN